MMRRTAIACALLILVAAVTPAAAAANGDATAYSGTHVSFGTENDAVVDYAVGDETMLDAVSVRSASETESSGDVRADAELSAVTALSGSSLSVDSTTAVSATVAAESGATLRAHDNPKGVLVVRSGGESQYVTANVSAGATAESAGESRAVVTTDDGTEGTFLVIGDGRVTVNDGGDVTARLGSDGKLVFRSYPEERDEHDRKQERLIADGTAAAEVYVMAASDGSGDLATDVVRYGSDTTVEVTERSEGRVRMTADRSANEGRVVIASVSEAAIDSVEDVRVTVDGEAAAEASSYSELEGAIGGDRSKYLVRQQSSAEAQADVLVAVNHFSERQVTVTDGDGGGSTDSGGADGTDGSDGTDDSDDSAGTSASGPGFGVGSVLVALVLTALGAVARRR